MDIQFIIFVRHISGQSIKQSAISLFIVIFVMVCASLIMVPLLSYLIYKNESKANKAMNTCLIIAIISSFVFCLSFNSYFKDRSQKGGAEVFLGLMLLALIIYVGLKNSLKNLYYNLISILYMENDHRMSDVGFKSLNTSLNFVDCVFMLV